MRETVSGEKMITGVISRQRIEPVFKARLSEKPADDDIIAPPVLWADLINQSAANAYHMRCIEIKALNMLRYELPDADKEWLETLVEEDTFDELLLKILCDYAMYGNGYLEVERTFGKGFAGLYHIEAKTMYLRKRGSFLQNCNMKEIELQPFGTNNFNEVMHFKAISPLSGWYGVPSWLPAIEQLRIDRNIKLFIGSFFDNSAVPDFAVIIEGAGVDPEAETKIKRALSQTKGVSNAHKTLVLGLPHENAKVRFESLTSPVKDVDFSKLQTASREEVLAAHGVPPRLLGIVTSGQLGGEGDAQGQLQTFYETVIQPAQKYIQGKLNYLLTAAGRSGRFAFYTPDIAAAEGSKDTTQTQKSARVQKAIADLEHW